MTFLRIILVGGVLIGALVFFVRIAPGRSMLIIKGGGTQFPVVSGYNLERVAFEFPQDFAGDLNLVMIAFQQYHQQTVNTWIPLVQEIEASFPGFIYYELPTITGMPVISRTLINEGMRAGIPDRTARERTVTLYLDKDAFKDALSIQTEDDIQLFLVDRDGNILWRGTGEYTSAKAKDLIETIQKER